jgi:hypothetical protein
MAKADVSEIQEMARILARAAGAAPKEAKQVVSKGLLNIKKGAKRRVEGLAHAPAYPRSITYDTGMSATAAWGEVGPDKDKRQGALGNLLEYGSVNNAPIPHIGPESELEKPRFEKALEDLGANLVDGVR